MDLDSDVEVDVDVDVETDRSMYTCRSRYRYRYSLRYRYRHRFRCRNLYVHMYTHTHFPPPNLLAICLSTVLSLQMLSPRSRNHRCLQWFLHFTRADLYFLCLCKLRKTQTRIWFCVSTNWKKHLSLAQLTMTLETSIVSA